MRPAFEAKFIVDHTKSAKLCERPIAKQTRRDVGDKAEDIVLKQQSSRATHKLTLSWHADQIHQIMLFWGEIMKIMKKQQQQTNKQGLPLQK